MLSDRFGALGPERAGMLKKLLKDFSAYETVPADLWENTFPGQWAGVHRKTGKEEVGLFNFGNAAKIISGVEVKPHSFKILASADR